VHIDISTMTSRNRGATRKRLGGINTEGGILGLIDGNSRHRPSLRQTTQKKRFMASPPYSPQSSSSSGSNDSVSATHTPPPKTVLFSTLAGSPQSDNEHSEEEEMSDLSIGTPQSSHERNVNDTPESDYSLKPLIFKEATDECADSGADYDESSNEEEEDDSQDDDDDDSQEDSNDGNESDVIDYENGYSPDSRASVNSDHDSQEDDSLDSIGLDDDDDSVEQEEASFEESDDEFVLEESSSDTEDEDLDADIVVDLPSKRQRGGQKQTRRQPATEPQANKSPLVAVKDHANVAETQNLENQDDETVQEEEESKTESSSALQENKSAVKENPRRKTTSRKSKAESSSALQENKSPVKEKPQRKTISRKIPVVANKSRNTQQKKDRTTNKDASSQQEKKASIYKESCDHVLPTEQELVVIAQVLEGVNLDDGDDDDDVVIAEVIVDGDADVNDDVLATVVVDDTTTETPQKDHDKSKHYSDRSYSDMDEEAASVQEESFEEQSNEEEDDGDEQFFSMNDEIEPAVSSESIAEPAVVVIHENETLQRGDSGNDAERVSADTSGFSDESSTLDVSSPSAGDKAFGGETEVDTVANALYEIPHTSPSIDDESSISTKKILVTGDFMIDALPSTENVSPVCSCTSCTSERSDSPIKMAVASMDYQSVKDVAKAVEQSPVQPPLPQKQEDIDKGNSVSPPVDKDKSSTHIATESSMVCSSTRDVDSNASEREKQVEVVTLLSPSGGDQIVSGVASKDTNEGSEEIENSHPKSSFVSISCVQDDAFDESVPIIAATKPNTDDHETRALAEPDRRPRLRRFRSEGSITRGKWGTGSKIGVGSFGVVRVGMNKKTGTLMAVKSISVSSAVMKDIQTEIDLLKSLDHINIVRYLGAETDEKNLHIFQEWVPGGSVTSLLHKFGPFSMQVIRVYLFQILSGLSYLHDNRILHRDIKGGNVLVSDAGVVKLADFGSSKRLVQQQIDGMETLTMRGTPYFMAPEVFEEKYGSKADIWSVGCVAFQMATGSPPWKGMGLTNPMSLFLHIKDTEGIPTYEWPNPDEDDTVRFKAMLERCFYRDPSLRPTAKELAADPFFTASEQSSSEDNQSRGLFSPGGDSISTWGTTRSPKPTPTRSSPASRPAGVTFGQASFLSPPLPTRIHQGSHRQDMISPLAPSPVFDASEWPSWARERLQDRKSPYKMRPESAGSCGLPPPSPSKLVDSLVANEGSSIVNPFRRKDRKSGDSSLGTADSLAVSEDSSIVNPFRRKGRTSGDSSLGSSLVGLDFVEEKSEEATD
jgi:serine/threonine protein kinase